MLFEPAPNFQGLPAEGFDVFAIPGPAARRRAIFDRLHPPLQRLAEDLLRDQTEETESPLHAHLPRLDWPPGYEPFCTWLALSREAQGYQSGPQLNVGVHHDHVAARLGWDTAADSFGRFEFLCRMGSLGEEMVKVCAEADLRLRVYAAAPWPEGSVKVFESATDLSESFDEVRRRGVWWEIGARYEWPARRDLITSAELGNEIDRVFSALMPIYERLTG